MKAEAYAVEPFSLECPQCKAESFAIRRTGELGQGSLKIISGATLLGTNEEGSLQAQCGDCLTKFSIPRYLY